MRNLFRHGNLRLFHLNHALAIGPGAVAMVIVCCHCEAQNAQDVYCPSDVTYILHDLRDSLAAKQNIMLGILCGTMQSAVRDDGIDLFTYTQCPHSVLLTGVATKTQCSLFVPYVISRRVQDVDY